MKIRFKSAKYCDLFRCKYVLRGNWPNQSLEPTICPAAELRTLSALHNSTSGQIAAQLVIMQMLARNFLQTIALMTLMSLPSFVLSTQADPATTPPAPRITQFLKLIGARGAEFGCNPKLVADALGARIESPKIQRDAESYVADFEIVPDVGSYLDGKGQYRQFRSSTANHCNITFNLVEGAVCDVHSQEHQKAVGASSIPIWPNHPPASLIRDQTIFYLFRNGRSETPDTVYLTSRFGERCIYRVNLRTQGQFVED